MDPRMLPIISDFATIFPTALSDAIQADRGGDRPGQPIETNGGTVNTIPLSTSTVSTSPLPSIKTGPTQTSTTTRILPTFLLTNIRSFGNSELTDKSTQVQLRLDSNNIDVACLTETWLTEDTEDRPSKLIDGYLIFNSVRKNIERASGGISLFVKHGIPASKLNIDVPEHIETIWISIRPKWLPRAISTIIVAGVYYPGSTSFYAPNQDDIILHITETVHLLSNKYVKPLFMIMGDFNNLKIDEIVDACNLKQVVKVPTRNDATLDLILTNINNEYYENPTSLPSIAGSDHLCVLYKPLGRKIVQTKKRKITIRKFKESAIIEFGAWLVNFSWSDLLKISDVNQKIAYFVNIMWIMIDKFFPPCKIVISDDDKEWITPEIKRLIKERQKAHKSKRFDARDHLASKIKEEIKKAKVKYHTSKAATILSDDAKEWYRHLAKIIGNGSKSNLLLNNVPELALKPIEEIVAAVNKHFGIICQTYPPLDKNLEICGNPDGPELKLISEFDTYKLLKKFSKKSLGPDDFPKRILVEFAVELALPFSDITNCALKTGIFPDAYKISEIVPIPKENPPRALKDLRPISKTPIGGKILENIIISELEQDTKNTLNDTTQYRNAKGCSTTH